MKAWNLTTLLVIVVACGVNVVAMARRVPPPPRVTASIASNPVMRHEQRMAAVRHGLETRGVRGTIGYVADVPATELHAQPRAMEEYFLTQFALVPRILEVKASDYEWVVANLRTAPIAERTPSGYRVIDDCGGGVFLLRKTERAAP
jgi:hypothetical protein